MAAFTILLGTLQAGFLKPEVYKALIPEPNNDQYDMSGGPARKSALGTPVFSDLKLSDGEDELTMETLLIDVSMRKNIVTTTVQGRPGTVKEYISGGDYQVRLRGSIVRTGKLEYPYAEVRTLLKLLSQPVVLEAVGEYLRLFDVYSLVVSDYNFAQNEGRQNTQTFEINCISDQPEELIEDADTIQ